MEEEEEKKEGIFPFFLLLRFHFCRRPTERTTGGRSRSFRFFGLKNLFFWVRPFSFFGHFCVCVWGGGVSAPLSECAREANFGAFCGEKSKKKSKKRRSMAGQSSAILQCQHQLKKKKNLVKIQFSASSLTDPRSRGFIGLLVRLG